MLKKKKKKVIVSNKNGNWKTKRSIKKKIYNWFLATLSLWEKYLRKENQKGKGQRRLNIIFRHDTIPTL